MRTEQSPSVTLRLVSGGKENSGDVLSPYGPVRAGLTPKRLTQEVQLEELLSCLENRVATLESKFLGVLDTFLTDTTTLAIPYDTSSDTGGTK